MKILLDTHAFLWWLGAPDSLSGPAQSAIRERANEVFVSAATAWEIVIKRALGKLRCPENLEEVIERNNFAPLPISVPHALAAGALPAIHADPFDRMLIAQASVEGLVLITRDESIRRYPIPTLPA
ncbi:MAG: type II toxin-antitoxin system VapC family toxin [Bryobacteraceae bacterium]